MATIVPIDPPSGNPEKIKSLLFHRFPLHFWDDQSLSLHERIVLCRVWSFENSTPPLPCYLSFEQWARELGCTRRHAINLLGRLVERSFLIKESRGFETNIWRLVNTVHYQRSDSEYSSPLIVNTVHYPSEYSSPLIVNTVHPRRSLEDHKEDHKEEDHQVEGKPSPKPSPHQFLKTELTDQQRVELLKILTTPAKIANQDPSVILDELLKDLERWCHASTEKRRFKECWFETLKRQWVGKKIKQLTAKPVKIGLSGLSEKQKATRLEYIWKKIHNLPLIPEKPFNSEIDYQVSAAALASIFGEKFKPEIERKKPDAWTFFKEQFSESYERAIEKIKNQA